MRTDNRTTMAYINRQGGVCSTALLKLAEDLWLWALEHLDNGGANLMFRAGPLPDEWGLHPLVGEQIWA